MARIGVTGGAGFIGSHLVRLLSEKGHEVVVVDNLSTGLISNLVGLDCEFHNFSILETEALQKTLSDCSTILHLAARGSVPLSIEDPLETHQVNSTGTVNVLNVARRTGAHVVFTSSSSVYGSNKEMPKRERTWLSPLSPYGASKLSGEANVLAYSKVYGFPVTVLRLFNIFGPKQRYDLQYSAVIPKWIAKASLGLPIEIFGDGFQSRDFTYVDSLVEIIVQATDRKIHSNCPINVAFGNRVALIQVIEELKKYFPNIQVEYRESRPGDIEHSQNDPKLLKSTFPNILEIPFHEGLRKTVEWYVNSL